MLQQRLKTLLFAAGAAFAGLSPATALGADGGFTGGVTPSRFELRSEQGKLLRNSVKIYNLGARPQQFNVKTVDWQFSEAGQISFQDELATDSCREWVRLERHRINVVPDPQRPRNFRFEVQIPEDAPEQECRFALMIESLDGDFTANFANGAVQMPISGRIAVIVYLGVGDVEPQIEIGKLAVQRGRDDGFPSLQVANKGSAHGRLDADLFATDPDGERVKLSIATSPIMPGQQRHLLLTPESSKSLNYPVKVTGKVYTDKGAARIDQTIQKPVGEFVAKK